MYYEVMISTTGIERDDFIRHLYNNGYNFYEAKHDDSTIFVLEDEIEYIQTIADEWDVNIEVCNL